MGTIKHLGERRITLDEQIAKAQTELAPYRRMPADLVNVEVLVTCTHCLNKCYKPLGRYIDRYGFHGFLMACPVCNRELDFPGEAVEKRLIAEASEQIAQGLIPRG